MTAKQNPTDQQSLAQWSLYKTAPRERRMNVVSEFVTIYGEAPSGAHEAEPLWVIWKETKDENGRITTEFAQEGRNDLIWIYNSVAFNPAPDLSGRPYAIQLDNNIVYDGMFAGLPVANITVFDIDDLSHTITDVYDPANMFEVVGNVLVLTGNVQLNDIAYQLKLRATDDDGNSYDQWFAIYVQETPPVVPPAYIGEVNDYEESTITALNTATVLSYTIPTNRAMRLRKLDVFGTNLGAYEVQINGDRAGYKETYYTRYETEFDFDNYTLNEGDTIEIISTNKGSTTALFNARLRGYQYAK